MADSKPTVVVIGAGFGGQAFMKQFKELNGLEHAEVLVFERASNMLLGIATDAILLGEASAADLAIPMKDSSACEGVLNQETVVSVNTKDRKVVTDQREVTYDYLVVAAGAGYNLSKFPGLAENADNTCSAAGNAALREKLLNMKSGKAVMCVPSGLYKCPPSPIQWACLMDSVLREGGNRDNVSLEVYSFEPFPLPIGGPENGKFFRDMMAARGITFNEKKALSKVTADGDKKTLHFADGSSTECDVLASVFHLALPEFLASSGLPTGGSGMIPVDRVTMECGDCKNVFVVGDCSEIIMPNSENWSLGPGVKKPYPKTGILAVQQAERAARVVANRVFEAAGKSQPCAEVEGKDDGNMVCFLRTEKEKGILVKAVIYSSPDAPIALVNIEPPSQEQLREEAEMMESWMSAWMKADGAASFRAHLKALGGSDKK